MWLGAFDRARPQKPTNRLLGRISAPTGSNISLAMQKGDTSGAMNSGVPQKVLVVLPYPIFSLHNP